MELSRSATTTATEAHWLVRARAAVSAALDRWSAPVDGASLRTFRALFGVVMLIGTLRFWARGWISSLFVAPELHFHYFGFSWVEPLPGFGMYAVFALMALAALGVALGRFYRASIAVFLVCFVYAELCEKAAYLNHYYLATLLALLLACMPATSARVPRWTVLALRCQIGLVYFFAGLCKLDADWLLEAEPLRLWLSARSDLPLVGSLLGRIETAYACAWLGAAFDLSAPFLLSWRRSRGPFYVLVVGFHLFTALLFPMIGVFPWLMVAASTIFFDPRWPARLLGAFMRLLRIEARSDPACAPAPVARLSVPALALLALFFAVQIALPIRHLAYPGPASWTDEGFRFAWRVMLVDKLGSVRFDVVERDGPRRFSVVPSEYLTKFQAQMMSQSPDMIRELAQYVASDFRSRHGIEVAVYADAWASLNGRAPRRLIDPGIDLARESDGLGAARFIEPLESR